MEWLYPVGFLISSLAAVLAWITKLKWSREYRAVVDKEISALKDHINLLKDMSPTLFREWVIKMREQYEEIIKELEIKLRIAESNKNSEKNTFLLNTQIIPGQVLQLEDREAQLKRTIDNYKKQINDFKQYNDYLKETIKGLDPLVSKLRDAARLLEGDESTSDFNADPDFEEIL